MQSELPNKIQIYESNKQILRYIVKTAQSSKDDFGKLTAALAEIQNETIRLD